MDSIDVAVLREKSFAFVRIGPCAECWDDVLISGSDRHLFGRVWFKLSARNIEDRRLPKQGGVSHTLFTRYR